VSGSCKLILERNSTGALIQSVETCLIAKLQNNGTQPLIGNLATTFSGAFIMCITQCPHSPNLPVLLGMWETYEVAEYHNCWCHRLLFTSSADAGWFKYI